MRQTPVTTARRACRIPAGMARSIGSGQVVVILAALALAWRVDAKMVGKWDPIENRIGIDIHVLRDDARLDLVRDSGMGWVRADFDWWSFNPAPGVFDFSTLDAVVSKATARGLKIFPSIGYTPTWATSGDFRTGVPDNVGDWTTAVTTVVNRYRNDIQHWGIWNEPNTTGFWTGTRQQFIDVIVKPAADAIHAADPNALVVGPELAHFVSAGRVFYEWLDDILTQAGDRIDILSHHTYPRPLASDHTSITRQLDADTLFGDNPDNWGFLGFHPSLREVLEALGWSGDVWLTEFGWRTTDLSEQQIADNYTGLFNDWLTGDPSRNWIDKFMLYHAETDEYGLFNPDGSPRPAYFAIRDFVDLHSIPEPGVGALFSLGCCVIGRRQRRSEAPAIRRRRPRTTGRGGPEPSGLRVTTGPFAACRLY